MDSESKPSENDRESSQLSSPHDSSDSDEAPATAQTEWLATTRARRATAGNRMKSMLANEEPDSDLELLFAEDENDQGFSDADADASDMQMDSSSDDDDDANNAGDDLEGEKELERQDKERRDAQRKRKARGGAALPAKFRKKVRIDPSTPTTPRPAAAAPAPRPKKKSERASWLPSPADLPTRASSRSTTALSKVQLHQQMAEREAKRLKQLALMQKKAERLEALRKPPMTQEERLREAAIVEKRNSKSLNRWEEAEKQREEEQRAKLAALSSRTLRGPVISFWSGIADVEGGDDVKRVGRYIAIEEPPKKKRREKVDKSKDAAKADPRTQEPKADKIGEVVDLSASNDPPKLNNTDAKPEADGQASAAVPSTANTAVSKEASASPAPSAPASSVGPSAGTQATQPPVVKHEEAPGLAMPPPPPLPSSGLAAPAPPPETGGPVVGSLMAPPGMARPPDGNNKLSGFLAPPSLLAPPSGISINGPTPPTCPLAKSNILAPPNPEHNAGLPPPISTAMLSSSITNLPPPPPNAPATAENTSTTSPSTAQPAAREPSKPLQPIQNPPVLGKGNPSPADTPVDSPPVEKPPPASTACNAIIFQNFNENAIRDKTVQTQILFGRKMAKLSKPTTAPLCVITNHPAKYRDPHTGLPYANANAYREIQRLCRGEYRWSRLLGAWVGSGASAARGVPQRFLNPEAKREEPPPQQEQEGTKAPGEHGTKADTQVVSTGQPAATGNAAKAQPSPGPTPVPATVIPPTTPATTQATAPGPPPVAPVVPAIPQTPAPAPSQAATPAPAPALALAPAPAPTPTPSQAAAPVAITQPPAGKKVAEPIKPDESKPTMAAEPVEPTKPAEVAIGAP